MAETFVDKVNKLREAATVCDDLSRVASPFFKAATWEVESGKAIASVVGTNSAFDIYMAADALYEAKQDCSTCTAIGNKPCQFLGVQAMTPDEILTLVD